MPVTDHMPDGSLVKEIAALVHPTPEVESIFRKKVLIVGKETMEFDDPSLPEPKAINISTLQGVADFVNSHDKAKGFVIVVDNPTSVRVTIPHTGPMAQTLTYVAAGPLLPDVRYSQYLSIEDFQIMVQSRFIQTVERDAMLKVAGNLKSGIQGDVQDDGVSQTVATSASITRAERTPIKNPILLAPFRTFPEIQQPVSPFILRMQQTKQGDVQTVSIALFEADGGAWRVEAISAIGAWLKSKIDGEPTILA